MPRKPSLEVEVEPSILAWALNNSGWDKKELLEKAEISESSFDEWLAKSRKPTVKQLEKLAHYLKRPLAVFFLPQAPEEKPLPQDYRMIPDKSGKFDKRTILSIRKARRLQNVSKLLAENIMSEIKPDISYAVLSDDAKEVAKRYRESFKITVEDQAKWKSPREAFRNLREIIESKNLLVFQFKMPMEDARGFAIVDNHPFVIVVNSSDQIEARIFTLIHELGHALLKKSGISMPENAMGAGNVDMTEKWCNDFASEFLLPESLINELFPKYKGELLSEKILGKLSRDYKLSKSMLIYNMFKYNFISSGQYHAIFERFKLRQPKPKNIQKKGGGVPSDKRCISEKGQTFVTLVSRNVEAGKITYGDALDYLSIKSKGFDKLNARLKK